MENVQKIVVGKNYSVNHDATVLDPKTGTQVSAKDVLCAEAPAAILALQAAEALTQNIFMKMLYGTIASAIQGLLAVLCPPTVK
jgi:hypothetical protein